MGHLAGETGQGTGAVAIGFQAGATAQGEFALSIGYEAGATGQGDNTIILNASGSNLSTTATGAFFVKEVRTRLDATTSTGPHVLPPLDFQPLYYSPSTGEIVYLPIPP